jgi:hypothetical protein
MNSISAGLWQKRFVLTFAHILTAVKFPVDNAKYRIDAAGEAA